MRITTVHRALGAFVAALTLAGCASTARTVPPNEAATVYDIATAPETYYGDMVTVSGQVANVYTPYLFAIGGTEYEGGLLLVAIPTNMQPLYRLDAERAGLANDIVQVTGRVQRYDPDLIKNDPGVDALGPEFGAYDGKPMIFATELKVTRRRD